MFDPASRRNLPPVSSTDHSGSTSGGLEDRLSVTLSTRTKASRASTSAISGISGWRSRRERGPRGNAVEPFGQLRVPGAPAKTRIARFEAKGACERDLDHIERPAHERVLDFALPGVRHASGAIRLVLNDPRRALVRGPQYLAAPDGKAVQHASRQCFEAACLPRSITARRIERRLAIQMVEVGANESGFLHADAVVTHQIGDAAGRIDAVVGTVRSACLCGDRLHPAR